VIGLLCALLFALYLAGVRSYRRRFPQREFSNARVAYFGTGLLLLALAFFPAADALADRSFLWHMAQHLMLMLIVPPLLLLGAPLLLLVAATPRTFAAAIARAAHSPPGLALLAPVTGWLGFVFVLWVTHFSPLYESALEHPVLHALEHALFFGSGLLFWNAVVQVGYAPRPVAYPARMLYLFLALPQGAFAAFAIGASRHALYAHYAATLGPAAALNDQRAGADLMWIAGGFLLFCAFMIEAATWAAVERRAVAA
jgi:cytochrome c oxidase assembly factor CtaG